MIDHGERVVRQSQHSRHQFRRRNESRRHHRDRRGLRQFGADRVMQTARRTTASVAETGYGEIPVPRLVHDVLLRRRAVVRLGAMHDFRYAEALPQEPVEMGEEADRTLLAIGDETDGRARQGGRPRRRPFIGSANLARRIKYANRHIRILHQPGRNVPSSGYGPQSRNKAPLAQACKRVPYSKERRAGGHS